MGEAIHSLGDVLANIDNVPWVLALYLDPQRPWTEATRCAVLDPNDVDDPHSDDVPEYAAANGLVYAIQRGEARDIVSNARQQRADATLADFMRAFNLLRQRCLYRVVDHRPPESEPSTNQSRIHE